MEQDLQQVLEICNEVREYHINILNGYFLPQDDKLEKVLFLKSLETDKIIALVSEENKKINGYLLAEFKDMPFFLNSKIAIISNFGVSKKSQHKGIGKKLMDSFCTLCEKEQIHELHLTVYNQNETAHQFYKKYGFKSISQKMSLDLTKK